MNNLPIQSYESVVQQRDALEKKLADMAADNAALKASQSEIYDYTQQFTSSDDREMWNAMHDIYKLSSPLETQATDSFLSEVQAQGVDKLAIFAGKEYQRFVGDKPTQRKWKGIVMLCTDFAAQLRKGINDAQ